MILSRCGPFSLIRSASLLCTIALVQTNAVDTGYVNSKLPGHPDDKRGLPNLPFTVDANRESDGISSVSPLTTTASSFPQFTSGSDYANYGIVPASELQYRKDHHSRLTNNQRIQGLAGPFAGEAEREAAAYNRLVEIGTSQVPLPSESFLVDSAKRWNPSAFPIQRYELYRIEVHGDQRWTDGTIQTSADGYTSRYDAISKCYIAAGRCRSYLKTKLRVAKAGSKWLQLICGIGEYVSLLQHVDENQHRMMPLLEDKFIDTLFEVGKSVVINASHSGELVCFANDADTLYFNNRGVINVTVTRESWPPLRGGYTNTTSNSTRWPLRYRWPPAEYLEIKDYQGPI
jgi:hypothetical protein